MDDSEQFPIVDISQYEPLETEQLGTKSKFWYRDENNDMFLFKSINTKNKKGDNIQRIGEDWAEKIASELAELLGVPHAEYDLAVHRGINGVITKNFISNNKGEYLTLGNELIENVNRKGEFQNVIRVDTILNRIIKKKPLNFDSYTNIKTASEFFTGYLMFDTLISNQDRHSENWGMVETTKKTNHLAPTFDHAASLGRNESDKKRIIILENQNGSLNISQYVSRANSYFTHKDNRLKVFDVFKFFAEKNKSAALEWISKLETLSNDNIRLIINRVPDLIMTEISKDFAYELICQNKANILMYRDELTKLSQGDFQ